MDSRLAFIGFLDDQVPEGLNMSVEQRDFVKGLVLRSSSGALFFIPPSALEQFLVQCESAVSTRLIASTPNAPAPDAPDPDRSKAANERSNHGPHLIYQPR
jgi:hypothetical protein